MSNLDRAWVVALALLVLTALVYFAVDDEISEHEDTYDEMYEAVMTAQTPEEFVNATQAWASSDVTEGPNDHHITAIYNLNANVNEDNLDTSIAAFADMTEPDSKSLWWIVVGIMLILAIAALVIAFAATIFE